MTRQLHEAAPVTGAPRRCRLRRGALPSQLDDGPADLLAGLIDALDIRVLCRPEHNAQ